MTHCNYLETNKVKLSNDTFSFLQRSLGFKYRQGALSTNFVQLSVCALITGRAPSKVFFPSVLHKHTEAVLQIDISLCNLRRESKSSLCVSLVG